MDKENKEKDIEIELGSNFVFEVERNDFVVCTQCNKRILDGQQIFMDSDGYFPPKIEEVLNNLQIYHYNCIVPENKVSELELKEQLKNLKEKCDSELKKMVLDEILHQKLPLPDEVQKLYTENDIPIVTADFYYKQDKNEIYIYGELNNFA